MQRTNRGILVRGSLAAPLRRTCARCLEPFVEEVEVPIAEEFLPTLDPTTGAPARRDGGEESSRIDEHHEIDLAPIVPRRAEPD